MNSQYAFSYLPMNDCLHHNAIVSFRDKIDIVNNSYNVINDAGRKNVMNENVRKT